MKKVVLGLILTGINVFSNPSGEKVVSGEASFSRGGNKLEIAQSSDKAIVNWESFSIGKLEKTIISQPTSSSILLNRVIGQTPTSIEGMLEANGHIYLINPKGIMVGKEGVIKTAGFLASTLNMADSDFLSGIKKFEGDSFSTFENKGIIESTFGDVYIIAPNIKNSGNIKSENKAILVAANDIYIVSDTQNLIIKIDGEGYISDEGLIEAKRVDLKAAGGDLSNLAINQKGIIRATAIVQEGGEVYLSSEKGTVEISGQVIAKKDDIGGIIHILGENIGIIENAHIDASGDFGGGTILIGGDYKGKNPDIKNATCTFVDKNVLIDASCSIEGEGGRVIVWADGKTSYYGKILAFGGENGGNGGFIEVSGKNDLVYRGNIDLTSFEGKAGTLLLDPSSINITAAVPPSVPAFANPYNPNSDPVTAILAVSDLTTALAGANVVITTVDGGSTVNGVITVTAPISWSADTSLTLLADRDLDVNVQIQNTHAAPTTTPIISLQGGLNRDAGNNALDGVTIVYLLGVNMVDTDGGDIEIIGTGSRYGVVVTGAIQSAGGSIDITGTSVDGNNDGLGITISSTTGRIETTSGNITLTGNGSAVAIGQNNTGIVGEAGTIIKTDSGDITLNGNGGSGTLKNRGMRLYGAIINTSGDIHLVGKIHPNVTTTENVGILMEPNASILVDGTGSIFLDGGKRISSATVSSTSNNYGVGIFNSTIKIYNVTPVADTGSITIDGISTDSDGINNYGIYMSGAASEISSNGTLTSSIGDITLIGTGGGSATGSVNYGVFLDLSKVTTVDSDISITGTGGLGTQRLHGVYLTGAHCETLIGSGNIEITGYGGDEIISNGIYLLSASYLKESTDSSGSIILKGYGGDSSSSTGNHGVSLETDSYISNAGTGLIDIEGTGGTGGDDNVGISLLKGTGTNSYIESTDTGLSGDQGSITLNGTAGASDARGYGVFLSGSYVETVEGDVSIIGTGKATTSGSNDNYGVYLTLTSHITTIPSVGIVCGDISINGYGGLGDIFNIGIFVQGSYIQTDGDGNLFLRGIGRVGDNPGGNNHGIQLDRDGGIGSIISTAVSGGGGITLSGEGGIDPAIPTNVGIGFNIGVYLEGEVSSASGAIEIDGIGHGTDNQNFGVLLEASAAIETSGDGTIKVNGTGGDGSFDNEGIRLRHTSSIVSTHTASTLGTITLIGTAGSNGVEGVNSGISLEDTAHITTKYAYMDIKGTGGAGQYNNYGVFLGFGTYIESTAAGNILIEGIGGGSSATPDEKNYGVYLNGAYISASPADLSTASIVITATGGVGTTDNIGLYLKDLTGASYIESYSGDIDIVANGGEGTSLNHGMYLQDSYIETTSGSITINSTSHGNANSNYGVWVQNTTDPAVPEAYIKSVGGDIDITGIGTTTAIPGLGSNFGINLDDAYVETIGGDITLTGSSNGTSGDNNGVIVALSGTNPNAYVKTTDAGNIIIEGTGSGTSGGSNQGVILSAADVSVLDVATQSYTGSITITGIGGNGISNNEGISAEDSNIYTDNGNITLTGTGKGTGQRNYGVNLTSSVVQCFATGGVDIEGTGGLNPGGTFGTSINYGLVMNTVIVETIDGHIDIKGYGNGTVDFNRGIVMEASRVESKGSGNLTLYGTGGGINTGTVYADASNVAVYLSGSTDVRSNTGNIYIEGRSYGNGADNEGFRAQINSGVNSISGDVEIIGYGADGTNENFGIIFSISACRANGGDLTLTGHGGNGSGDNNIGIYLNGISVAHDIRSGGDLAITGYGGSGTNDNYGVFSVNTPIDNTAGNVLIEGFGGKGTDQNYGVYFENSRVVNAAGITRITGTGGEGNNRNYGVYFNNNSFLDLGSSTVEISGTVTGTIEDNNHAVYFLDSDIVVDKNITILGTVHSTAGSNNYGIYLMNSEITSSLTDSLVSLVGEGFGGSADFYNHGIYIQATNPTIAINAENISLQGTGFSRIGYGVTLDNVEIKANNSGLLDVKGYGGQGDECYGVFLNGGSSLYNATGYIDCKGFAGDGDGTNYGDNYGIYIFDASFIESTSGNISLLGIGGTGVAVADNRNYGICLDTTGASSKIISTTGNIELEGTGGDKGDHNYGIYLNTSSEIVSAGGTITLTGKGKGDTNDNVGINLFSSSKIINTLGNVILDGEGVSGNNRCYGIEIIGSDITTTNGSITLTGGDSTSTLTEDFNHGIYVHFSSEISTAGIGVITLLGTTPTVSGNNNYGIYLDDSTLFATSKDLNLTGISHGGSGSSSSGNKGIELNNSASLSSTSGDIILNGTGGIGGDSSGIYCDSSAISNDIGDITFTGIGGQSNFSSVLTSSCHGVSIVNNSVVTNNSGNIFCYGNANSDGSRNDAINIESAVNITTTQSGNILLEGTNFGGNGQYNRGIFINDNVTISADLLGQITCIGTGGEGVVGCFGIEMKNGPTIFSSAGAISCTGYGGGTAGGATFSTGIDTSGLSIYSTNGGSISLIGEGGLGSIANKGLEISFCNIGNAATGTVTLKGKGAAGLNSFGIHTDTTTIQTSQNIFLITNSLVIDGVFAMTSSNNIYVRPYLDNGSMDIGFDGGGDLSLDEDTLEKLVNSTYDYFYFGEAGYGSDIIVGDGLGTTLSLDQGKVVFSGNNITIRNPIDAGTYDIKCEVGNTSPSTFIANKLVTTTGTFSVTGYVYNDIFEFPVLGQIASVDGGAGSNVLHVGSLWYITGENQGTVDNINFVNIQNLTGGANDDIFKFADQASIDGIIDGDGDGGGSYNILDYSEYTTSVFVNIPAHIATGTNGIYNINGYIPPDHIIPVFPDSIFQDVTYLFLGTMATNFDYFYKFSPYSIYLSIYLAFSETEFIEMKK